MGMKSCRGIEMNPSGDSSVSEGKHKLPQSAQLCHRAESKYTSALNCGRVRVTCVCHLLSEHDPDVHALMCTQSCLHKTMHVCVSDRFPDFSSPD